MSAGAATSFSHHQCSDVTICSLESDGTIGAAKSYKSVEVALRVLAGRSGSYFLKALSLTSEQARAIARCGAMARQELAIGVIPIARAPHTFLSQATAPLGRQVVFDGLRGSYSAARVTKLYTPSDSAAGGASLREPADVAYFLGHSNGLHADGVVGVLCRCGEQPPETSAALSCFFGDACAFPGRALPPHLIGARRIIALTCWGMRLDDLYERRLSVGAAILELPGLHSYVTTVRALNVPYHEISLFYFLVNSGVSFGELTNRVNRVRLREGLDVEYVCFGSPASTLPRTVGEGTTTCDDTGTIRVRLEAGVEPRDFVYTLPTVARDGVHAGQFMRFQGSFKPACAALDGSQFYMSIIEPVEQPREVAFRIARLEEMRDYAHLPADLLRDLAPTRAFFPFAAGLSPRSRRVIRKASDDLANHLVSWPFLSCEPGDCVTDLDIAGEDLQLRQRLQHYSGALLVGYRDLVRKGGPGGAVSSGSVWARLGQLSHRGASRCPHCGSAVVENTYDSIGQRFRRVVAYCDRCGLIRDCHPGLCGDLEGPRSVPLGAAFELSLLVENPYSHPLEVVGTAFIQALQVAQSAESMPVQRILAPGAPETVRFRIDPSFRYSGVYVLSACMIVGTRFNLLRSHIRLT